MYKLTSECHILNIPGNQKEYIAYFPLKFIALKVNELGADLLKGLKYKSFLSNMKNNEFLEYLVELGVVNGEPDPILDTQEQNSFIKTQAMLLLSESCNMKCVYCYSNSPAVGRLMPLDIALAAIDMVISNAIKSEIKNITIGFHGGGEPTTNWDVLTKSMIYVKNKSIEHDIKLNTYIVTNGVLSQNQVDWLGQNIISNTISIDGPPDVQNRQRPLIDGGPSYEKVAKAIDKFALNNVPYAFRTTITDYSEDRIPEIYDHLTTRFKPTMVCIEPLFSCGRSMTSMCRPPKMKAFLDGYSTVVKKIKNGISGIEYSGGRFHLLDSCFCGTARGNFIVTPRGDITSCVEISSREDPRADVFMYGKYNATTKKFEYQKDVYDKLFKMNVNNFISCKDCFARWHCSGDCPSKAPNMDALYTDRNTYRCEINKEIIKNQLMAKVGSL